nr:aminotransferase class V-fold PLP-dependent enzyme [Cytophagales bacterium]
MNLPIYLDHNATTPCADEVLEAMLPYFTSHFGNASSSHHPYGWLAAEAVDEARERVADLLSCSPKEILFTSGATEAINLAIRGTLFSPSNQKGRHIIALSTEHSAVLDTCKHLENQGVETTYLPVSSDGLIIMDELKEAIRSDTVLICVMVANNETGVLQPISEIGQLADEHNIVFLADGVQAAGKIPVNVQELRVDFLPLSAHKMYGPKGSGALFVRKKNQKIALQPQVTGGGHEWGKRSGTLNIPGIVGLGKAAQVQQHLLGFESQRLKALRDKLETAILTLPGTQRNGAKDQRLPHVSNISFDGVNPKDLLIAVNKAVAVSSGSACSSVTERPSHVLKAMGLTDALAKSSLRFSLGKATTEKEILFAIAHINETLTALRKATTST